MIPLSVTNHQHVPVLHDVFFALEPQQALIPSAGIAAVIDERLPIHDFSADEFLLESPCVWLRPPLPRVDPAGMVHARTSVSPAVRNDINPSKVIPGRDQPLEPESGRP